MEVQLPKTSIEFSWYSEKLLATRGNWKFPFSSQQRKKVVFFLCGKIKITLYIEWYTSIRANYDNYFLFIPISWPYKLIVCQFWRIINLQSPKQLCSTDPDKENSCSEQC